HAPGVGLVHDDSAGPRDHWRVFLRLRGARRADGDLDALEGRRLDARDPDVLAAEADRLADGALGGEGAQLPHRELALLEDLERRLSGRARGADHRDGDSRSHQPSSSCTTRSLISRVPSTFPPGLAMSPV